MTDKEREYQRAYRKANAEKLKATRNTYRETNKEKLKEQKKLWRDANPDKVKQMNKRNATKRKGKANEYQNTKYRTSPIFKLRKNMSNAINKAFNRNGYPKSSKTQEIIGCTFEQLKEHIQSKFEPWMNWENHGMYNGEFNYGWDIDHILPVSSAITEDELINLNHYTNLQPLCSHVNRDIKKHYL